jgi:hypothetical protein
MLIIRFIEAAIKPYPEPTECSFTIYHLIIVHLYRSTKLTLSLKFFRALTYDLTLKLTFMIGIFIGLPQLLELSDDSVS